MSKKPAMKPKKKKIKDEVRYLFANLCSKMDTLSNYHFALRPLSEEVNIRAVSTPAIAMEEVMLLHVSTARGIVPEEVFAPDEKCHESVLTAEFKLMTKRKKCQNAKKTAQRKSLK